MNKIVSKLLLAEHCMHLRQPGFTYSGCETFTKNKEAIKNIRKQKIQNVFIKTN